MKETEITEIATSVDFCCDLTLREKQESRSLCPISVPPYLFEGYTEIRPISDTFLCREIRTEKRVVAR